MNKELPDWLKAHRGSRRYVPLNMQLDDSQEATPVPTAFNNHEKNTGEHVSPFDTGIVRAGVDGLEVRLLQGVDMMHLKQVVAAGTQATIGRSRPEGNGPYSDYQELGDSDWQEMFKGGLQTALESQTIVFEVWGASRVLTHQLVRSRRAGFHQQSQRSSWYGDRPEVRMPETVWRAPAAVRERWLLAYMNAWLAYQAACDAGVPYEDARYILPEGTVNYIQCEYTIREFINVYAYRGCSMFLREMVAVMRNMRDLVIDNCPQLEPYIKISCEKGELCSDCSGRGWLGSHDNGKFKKVKCVVCNGLGGARKCTFQGWENVEQGCDFPWAREDNRTFVASPRLRIGAS